MRGFSLETRINVLANKYGFHFRKNLGQNFLINESILDDIVATADLTKDIPALEIGPGMGFLTEKLADAAGFVTAVEIDPQLVALLRDLYKDEENIIIRQDDALKLNFAAVAAETAEHGVTGEFKIVANLPYYITTPLLFHFLDNSPYWSEMVLMVQKEVADRIVAAAGSKDYGVLTLMVAYDAEAEKVLTVPASSFRPRPNVDSAVIRLTKRAAPPCEVRDKSLFKAVVKAGFGQRRKTLANALTNGGLGLTKTQVEELLKGNNIDPKRRGETLNFEEFANLANALYSLKAQI
ncbi:MAG: 16S rRNA (adenine(1518)-N(6)/adenine(1519)-N(6))-dimethyltransferase RsmA [Bacillota bacterium]|nr:16S rRNA (adenine(1518)-N(6)/adenine(1519)-N(6))-dimethyltransferase RsmA [Bacillota bacterium]